VPSPLLRLEEVQEARAWLYVAANSMKGMKYVCCRGFGRPPVCWRSLSEHNLFNLENWLGLSDFLTVFADHAENLARVLRAAGLLDSALFELSIKEPLVDLNPGEASLCHGLLSNLSVQLPVVFLVEKRKNLDLLISLALTIGVISLVAG